MTYEPATPESRSARAWTFLLSWTGRITAIVGLCATITGGMTWLVAHHRQQRERGAQLALAQTQADQGDYQASVETYAVILKSNPLDRTAFENQLNTTMLWVENFRVLVPEGQSATEPAARALDEIMPILESGLTRSKGIRAADVQAHLGWAHWLNQCIAEREFGPAAEQSLRAALAIDTANVYAHAMLGNWMLQNHGNFSVAVEHLRAAAATGKARPFVRQLQIAGLADSYDQIGARAELVKVANTMRTGGEPLIPDEKRRVFSICCNVAVNSYVELVESLSAVPPRDAWLTYLWLEDSNPVGSSDPLRALTHDFIQAILLEISGQRPQALRKCRVLQQKLRGWPGTSLQVEVNSAVMQLAHSS
jgi:hypothetical protein